MAKSVTKSKKPRVSRAELAAIKSALIDELQGAYGELQKFCTGRPPPGVIKGDYHAAIKYKDLVAKTRRLSGSTKGTIQVLDARANRLAERLAAFQVFV